MKATGLLLACCLAAIGSALLPKPLLADTPLPPPEKKEVWSSNKQFCAVMDPRKMTTTVYHLRGLGRREKDWAMYGWFRVASLADDGEHLIVGHAGMNLLPLDIRQDDVMLYFFKEGKLINSVTLGELVERKSSLKRTASHYYWGRCVGLDRRGNYVVETVENRTLVFDVTTGKPVAMASSTAADPK